MARPFVSTSRRAAVAAVLALAAGAAEGAEIVVPRVVSNLPHDPAAFTQGLLLHDGAFFESTGRYGQSTVRRVDPATGEVLQREALSDDLFGEGLARVDGRLVQLTWHAGTALVRDLATLAQVDVHEYPGEGWGLCFDGEHLVMSSGSDRLQFRDPDTFELRRVAFVTLDGEPVDLLNELECVGELVYANVRRSDRILRIDGRTGEVLTEIDAAGLLTPEEAMEADDLNGIAFEPATGRFFLTGKLWPWVFETEIDVDPARGPCLPSHLPRVTGLRCERDSARLRFRWNPVDEATEVHLNAVLRAEDITPPGPHRTDREGGAGQARCSGVNGCDESLESPSDPALVFYTAVAACGPLGADEGPPD